MPPTGFDLNWAMIAGELVGCALVAGTLVFLFILKKRRREARNERPPQNQKLLRPAGYAAMCRLDELADELMSALAQALSAGFLFGMTAGPCYPVFEALALGRFTLPELWRAPKSEVLLAAACFMLVTLLWCVREIGIAWKLDGEMRNWRFGLRGEQAVAEALADRGVAAAGYVAFHDIPGSGKWNIDHVVVGPGGVFVIETKARARRKANRQQKESVVIFDGRALEFPWCEDCDAVEQVQRNAAWVREFLSAFPPKNIPIQPVIVTPGWWTEVRGNYPVKLMNATYLVEYLKGAKRLFAQDELEPVIQRLDERCRTVEF